MITEANIRRAIGEPSFSRGESYFRRGMVRQIDIVSAGRLTGEVWGSGRKTYTQSIDLAHTRGGDLAGINGTCSCPVGYNCKHVAAAVLTAREELNRLSLANSGLVAERPLDPVRPPPPKKPEAEPRLQKLPGAVQAWLGDWRRPAAKARGHRPDPAAEPFGDRLFYVFEHQRFGEAIVQPFKGRLKKSGEIGANPTQYDLRGFSGAPKFLNALDLTLLAQLAFYSTHGYPVGYNWPDAEALKPLLKQIVDTGRARYGAIGGVSLAWGDPQSVSFSWEEEENGDQKLIARDDLDRPVGVLPFPVPLYVDQASGLIGELHSPHSADTIRRLANAPAIPPEAAGIVSETLANASVDAPAPTAVQIREVADLRPSAHLRLYGVDRPIPSMAGYYGGRIGEDGPAVETYPCIRLYMRYDGAPDLVDRGDDDDIRFKGEGGLVVFRRRKGLEDELYRRLGEAVGPYGGVEPDLLYRASSMPLEMREADFIVAPYPEAEDGFDDGPMIFTRETVPELQKDGWTIEIDDSWPYRFYEQPVSFSTAFEPSGVDWFSLSLRIEAGSETLDLTDLIVEVISILPIDPYGDLDGGFSVEEFLEGLTFYPSLEDGRMVPIEGEVITPFVEVFLEMEGLTSFHRAEMGRAAEIAEALEGCGAPWIVNDELRHLGAQLRLLADAPDMAPPEALKADLRPYQRSGYGWLRTLADCGYGGALADDMGLGKTVQALALLAHRHLELTSDRPSLLVAPTSLLGNWRREAERFAPGLRVLVLHGPGRKDRFGVIPEHDLVVTTYPLLNRDHEELFKHQFELAILDEAQAAKNPVAAVSKRIRDIDARQRLALTGTPMENNLEELWSLIDWLVPGLLGDRKSFNAEFRRPIERHGDRFRQKRLSARVKPFLLRRAKEDVVKDLPPKTIIDEITPLDTAQAALYESIRSAMDKRVRDAIAAKGVAGSRITILDALLKLRQACCDPALVKLDAARKVTSSAKRERLLSMLEELVAEGRKVLIFSQFVSMLKLIEADVAARGWSYSLLHGSTKDREAELARFQVGETQLFLISLKAGGVGLNLTAADTVILYDPWWNPAVERQAMDRAHRIGQDKPVFVHRLIAENTVEAAIQEMQARKQALADALFEGTGEGALALTEADIDLLLGRKK